jgi:uncharacterized protein (TIGR02145 family)
MKMLLLNLGQSGDSYTDSDAGDIGDFYQWGRVADGHEHIVWSKDAGTHANIIDNPAFGQPDGTSAVIAYSTYTKPNYNSTTHQVEDVNYNGKFISATNPTSDGESDWYYNGGHDDGLWGTAAGDARTNTAWDKSGNNPCPLDWTVPTSWNFWDLYKGTGANGFGSSSSYDGSDNTWHSFIAATNGAIGGTIITSNATGERVFLPAAGFRLFNYGTLSNIGVFGNYWSSTYYSSTTYARSLSVGTYVSAGHSSSVRAYGFPVRCVAENL